MIRSRLKFTIQHLSEKLWIKPLRNAVLAVAVVFVAHLADGLPLQKIVPDISTETVEKLLTVISTSMLGVATIAVASMVSAYASAGGSATPRAFALIISDWLSREALSSSIGAFIFSIVGIIAIKVGYFGIAGRFALFLFTIAIFAWVIVTFVRWVDNIARLGRLENTIGKVDEATREAFGHFQRTAPLGGRPVGVIPESRVDLYSEELGFIQHIDIGRLDRWAQENDAVVYVRSQPGAFVHPQRGLAMVKTLAGETVLDLRELLDAFVLAERRTYASDPRFGLIVMSEIGSRALSPGINDPGTAIDIVVRMSRIIRDWSIEQDADNSAQPQLERVFVPPLDPQDLLEDAYAAISKDGVGSVEVGIWLQRSLELLAPLPATDISQAARDQAALAFARAEQELDFPTRSREGQTSSRLLLETRRHANEGARRLNGQTCLIGRMAEQVVELALTSSCGMSVNALFPEAFAAAAQIEHSQRTAGRSAEQRFLPSAAKACSELFLTALNMKIFAVAA
ncbi:DUF2254 domain-containing protein [Profundibacterium mesophilum]|uniref:Membrane protein domain containing protein n=1 Tax=Profundibacterium mesophilum KAUST100406-0324 TaxID=1037889 RepID=A0A921TBM6_9RHOB|nr:DUF2254 domain-containing protein [Profundibacterium mesophilum]KAF0674503.1 putative membrane protein domain containing protein [Profundibacterium mesophilum KAUST100406-0324]